MALLQACAVPFRLGPAGLEFLAITNWKGKWIFPKGVVDDEEDGPGTAAKEAFEEAGVRGTVARTPFSAYPDRKWGRDVVVEVFLLRVEEVLDDWEEDDERERCWADPEAMRDIIRGRLRPILDEALKILDAGDSDRLPPSAPPR
ncbi:MAG: NUDIX domain-containing protein [Planctomycetes bacterium]|nr:NUDIX domain-containing protein [Planctomycetota bacterium]